MGGVAGSKTNEHAHRLGVEEMIKTNDSPSSND